MKYRIRESTIVKSWGIARFYGMGSMEYLLDSGAWLSDSKLFDGAPILLFETMAAADNYAAQLGKKGAAHGVQFLLDTQGQVVTARSQARSRTR